jgi:hypothetical protein
MKLTLALTQLLLLAFSVVAAPAADPADLSARNPAKAMPIRKIQYCYSDAGPCTEG